MNNTSQNCSDDQLLSHIWRSCVEISALVISFGCTAKSEATIMMACLHTLPGHSHSCSITPCLGILRPICTGMHTVFITWGLGIFRHMLAYIQ